MDPRAIIESYVSEVVRHLPRRQRNDVAFELRSLLTEDLEGRASDRGRPADDELAMELLTGFGRPQDVADRYRPAGFTIIRPADAPRFAWIALGGVVLQWAITLPLALLDPAGPDEWLSRLGGWWLSGGLGAFWWPGFLITFTIVAAVITHRRSEARGSEAGSGEARDWTPRRVIDPDRINRPVLVLLTALAVLGASILIALPSLATWAPGLPQPVLTALALDPDFVRWRAPWAVVLWLVSLVLTIVLLARGRWDRLTRRGEQLVSLAWIGIVALWVLGGDIFVEAPADVTTKVCLLLVAAIVIVDLAVSLRRTTAIRNPAV